jgi:dihydroorotate dehydrogenase electron transfer subunit
LSNPLHASHYADRARQTTVTIVENVRLARDTYRVRFECPEIASQVVPGQFLMLRLCGWDDPLLGRPLALYDTVVSASNEPIGIDVVYLVLGKMTRRLAEFKPGQKLDVWGPLGNGFSLPSANDEHLVMVAGGIGQTPFMALAREALGLRRYGQPSRVLSVPARKVTLCYGARSADYFAGLEDFRQIGVDVRLSTDDGTLGHRGFVTDLLRQVLGESPRARVVCCGPEPMMEAVAEITAHAQVTCQVSLETPMACGIGICFSCVARVRDDAGLWDYKRTCVEGPVFEAAQIAWK